MSLCKFRPNNTFRLKKIIKESAADPNVTILVSSHDLLHTVEVSDRIVAMHKGEVVKDIQTSPETLQELEQFLQFNYFGHDHAKGRFHSQSFYLKKIKKDFHYIPHAKGRNQINTYKFHFLKRNVFLPVSILKAF
jgi:ABC-type multidrug transport system ATPase subunit